MKNNHIILSLLGITFLILSACTKDKQTEVEKEVEYLPLKEGNYWEFDYYPRREIKGTKSIDGKSFYIMMYESLEFYYRIENNKVYAKEFGNPVGVKFKFDVKEGDKWNYNGYEVTLISKSETLKIGSKTLKNCYRFAFDNPEMVDDEHDIILAPDLGFVWQNCGECTQPVSQIIKAKINNRILYF
jgi:hypothetical protein